MKKKTSSAETSAQPEKQPPRFLVLHGPNLNLLGTREPQYYGRNTLADINLMLARRAERSGVELEAFQSNHEGALIERIHRAQEEKVCAIIFNPAAWTHSSIALRDAMAAVAIPFIEIHLSNIYSRESFRHHSYFSDLAIGTICGLGADGYSLALEYLLARIPELADTSDTIDT